jgi:enamine deaminase RidA (YjgF/YER057c/UK114 family)
MIKRIVNPPELAAPSGFSHGILAEGGRLLFLAGQDASDAGGRIVAQGDLLGQFEQVMANLQAVVTAAGGAMGDIVRLLIYVKDRDDYLARRLEIGQVFRRYFGDYYPAMALFEVSGFFQDACLVECEAIAVLE